MGEESGAKQAAQQPRDAGLEALEAEVKTWMPTEKGWPKVGQRVRLLAPHPWAGHEGVVSQYAVMAMLSHLGERPIVKRDDGPSCFIAEPQQWEPA